nr:PREDICTED: uncharacterized protein LOC108225667 [Daucus carota subsp. sativus]
MNWLIRKKPCSLEDQSRVLLHGSTLQELRNAAVKMGDNSFTVGLLRDHQSRFIIGKVKRLKMGSLVAGIYKAKYYADKDFMEANLGSSPSFIWRSILEGDLGWFMLEDRQWEIIRDIFDLRDQQLISGTIIEQDLEDDILTWKLENSGQYSVKSAYKLLQQEKGNWNMGNNMSFWKSTLLLGELLACLASKPLESETVLSLIGFFTERLADWKALHGALIGCLALLRRKGNVGVVSSSKALAVAQSYLQNVQVQSLRQSDRKLCFELLGCLLERYPDDIVHLDDVLIPGICESIDGEKDPECLMLAFHIVEVLVHLYPDPTGPLASFATDLFENLSCYFPIHFTHVRSVLFTYLVSYTSF